VQPELKEPTARATFNALIFWRSAEYSRGFPFIQQAHTLARSIARLTIPPVFSGVPDGNVAYGTDWIIAPGILMTNHHVVDARDCRPQPFGSGERSAAESDFQAQAERTAAGFDCYKEAGGSHLECRISRLLASSQELDYAIIELEQAGKIDDRHRIRLGDVRDVQADQLPRGLELATSSFPCIDVSLAGKRHGLAGKHSGLFREFARIVGELGVDYSSHVILIENVSGFANSHGGNYLARSPNKAQ
jgi:hypothetical protein